MKVKSRIKNIIIKDRDVKDMMLRLVDYSLMLAEINDIFYVIYLSLFAWHLSIKICIT